MNNNTNTLEQMVESVGTIMNAAQTVVDDMSVNDRMPVKDMAKTVGLALAVEPSVIFPFVNYFAHNTKEGYVSAGKTGGFIKGTRKTAPPVKSTQTEIETVITDQE